MKLGYHISIAGGLHNAINKGEALGCEAIQIFTSSPQSWSFDMLPESELKLFKDKWKGSHIKVIVAHAVYLANLASPNPYISTNTINSLLSSLEISDQLGLLGVITHMGSHKGRGVEEGIKRSTESINSIMKVYKGKVPLILEISAGAGDLLGRNFEEIGKIYKGIKDKRRIGLCIDTAHSFASGYDLRTKEGLDKLIDEIDNSIGIEKLIVLHINDSKVELGSNKDRHEDIGKGEMGVEAFRYIINHSNLKDLPGILETPSYESSEKGITNIEILRSLEK